MIAPGDGLPKPSGLKKMKKTMKKHKLAEFVPEPNVNEIKEKKKRNKVLGQNRGVKEMGSRSKAIVVDQYDIEASKSDGEDREKSKSKVLRKEKRKRDKMNNDTGKVDVLHDSGEDTLDRQNGEGEDREKSKSKVLRKEKRKRDKMNNDTGKVDVLHDSAEDTLDRQNGDHKQGKMRDVKSRKKERKTEKKKNAGNDKVNVLDNEVQDGSKEENGKSRKARSSKRKDRLSSKKEEKLEGKEEDVQNEVYEISSGDEDCTRGMQKWITEYHQSRPGLEILQQRIDDFMTAYEVQQEEARNEQEALAAEGGWTVVVHHKGRKKTTDTESGIAVGSVAQAAVMEREAKKKSKTKDVGVDFYRFQKREAQRNEIMALQSKFEQDKKRIQQLRAARKFRPY